MVWKQCFCDEYAVMKVGTDLGQKFQQLIKRRRIQMNQGSGLDCDLLDFLKVFWLLEG